MKVGMFSMALATTVCFVACAAFFVMAVHNSALAYECAPIEAIAMSGWLQVALFSFSVAFIACACSWIIYFLSRTNNVDKNDNDWESAGNKE